MNAGFRPLTLQQVAASGHRVAKVTRAPLSAVASLCLSLSARGASLAADSPLACFPVDRKSAARLALLIENHVFLLSKL